MALAELMDQGFKLEAGPLKEGPASLLAGKNGLTLPKGAGKFVFYRCINSGIMKVSLSSVWNAGRVSHQTCCGRRSATDTIEYRPTRPAHPTQALLLQHRAGLARASAVKRGSASSKLFDADTPTGPLNLRVTQIGIERSFDIPAEGVQWLKWIREVDLDPLNAPPPPTPLDTARQFSETVRAAKRDLQALAWALDRFDPTLNVGDLYEDAQPDLGVCPVIIPKYLFGSPMRVKPLDWSTTPPTLLSPTHVAALAVMLLEWSAAATSHGRSKLPKPDESQEGSLRHTILHDHLMAKPELVRPYEWFREIPAVNGTEHRPSPTAEMPDGTTVALRDHQHLILIGRPLPFTTLPANWHEPLDQWDWGEVVKVEVKWPQAWNDLPEIY